MLTWVAHDMSVGIAHGLARSPAKFVVVGAIGAGADQVATSPDGEVWTGQGSPFTTGHAEDCVWADGLGLFVANARNDGANTAEIWTSPDGIVWTSQGDPFATVGGYGAGIGWSEDLGLLVACNQGGVGPGLAVSSNGTLWTPVTSAFDNATAVVAAWCAGLSGGLFVAVGQSSTGKIVSTSPDGTVWTEQTTPWDSAGIGLSAAYDSVNGFAVVGGGGPGGETALTSANGALWTSHATPMDSGVGADAAACGQGLMVLGGANATADVVLMESNDGGASWTADVISWGGGETLSVLYDPILNVFVATSNGGLVAAIATAPIPPPPPPPRRPFGHLWRFVVADLSCTTLTLLDSLAEQRRVVYTLNAPAQAQGTVPSDNPQVNLIVGAGSLEGDPLVSYSDRILFGFRREGGAGGSMNKPWVIRFAGLLMQLEDAAGSDDARSAYTAYDPWQYLLSRPIRANALPYALPGPNGFTFSGADTTLDQIAYNFIANTIAADGFVFTDIDTGHIETIPFTGEINFQQATSVGDALTQLCNTGLMDIWFSPVYDPFNEPGIIARLNIYAQQGAPRYDSPMSWDSPPKSLVGISRLLDGTQLANKIQFYNGPAGPPVTVQSSADSAAKYGEYWAQMFFPAQIEREAVEDVAAMQLLLRQIGRRTLQINPAPERAPDPFGDYFLGDLLPVYATRRLRQTLPAPQESVNFQRVYGIPIDISDNSVETVQALLTSPDGFSP